MSALHVGHGRFGFPHLTFPFPRLPEMDSRLLFLPAAKPKTIASASVLW